MMPVMPLAQPPQAMREGRLRMMVVCVDMLDQVIHGTTRTTVDDMPDDAQIVAVTGWDQACESRHIVVFVASMSFDRVEPGHTVPMWAPMFRQVSWWRARRWFKWTSR